MRNEEFLGKEEAAGNGNALVADERGSSSRRDADIPGSSLKEKTAKGLFWGGFSNGMQQLLSLFFGIFLARTLDSHDYGMVGMLAIFSAVANTLQESGFTAALTNRKHATAADYNAVFWFSTLMGLCMYAVLFFCAPLIAAWFGKPELVPLSRVVFLGFLLSSMGIAHNAILFREMKVKQTSVISLVSLVLSGCTGLTLALSGWGYWSLAWQNVAFIAGVTVLRWYYAGWRPTLPVDFRPLREMFGFSVKLLLTNLVNQANSNLFSVILGRYYTPSDVGYYTQGHKWIVMGQQTTGGMINSVAQPVFTQVGDDNGRRIRVLAKLLRFTCFVSFPALLGLGFVSRELILVTIGAKWLPAVPIMQLLCVFGALWPVVNLYFQMAISLGRSDLYFWSNLLFGCMQIGVACLMFRFGILWMVAANVAGYVVLLLVWQGLMRRLVGFPWREAARGMLPYAGCALLSLAATHFVTLSLHAPWGLLLAKVAVAALLYVGMMKLGNSSILTECFAFALGKIKKKQP